MKPDHTGFAVRTAYRPDPTQRIDQFLPMVRKLAWLYQASGGATVDADDLMQAGMIALVECARRHDRPNDDGFAAYAKMRVRGAMIDLLRRQSGTRRSTRRWQAKLETTRDALRENLRREPSAAELAAALGQSAEEFEALRLEMAGATTSIEDRYSDEDMTFRDDQPTQEERLIGEQDRHELAGAIGQLPERQQLVLKLHFMEELNLTEIAEVLGVSVPRVHQLKAAALKKLRLALAG